MDYLAVLFVVALWALTLALSWSFGWLRGYDAADENHRWSRWLLRQYTNRSVRF
jgi:hypothetical protein